MNIVLENGVARPMTQSEITERNERDAAWTAGQVARDALAEIARLEAEITPRRIREAVTKPTRDVGGKTAAKWLEDQEDLIAIERAKL